MNIREHTADRLVLVQGPGRVSAALLLIVLAVFCLGLVNLLIGSATAPLILMPLGAAFMLLALIWSALLALTPHTTEITLDRREGRITFRHRALLRARHEAMALAKVTGVAVERTTRRFRQKDPATGKRRSVTDIAFRPMLLTPALPRPLLGTFTNQPAATEPARIVLRWLLQDPAAEPPVLDHMVDSPPSAA
ncbi:hypothetical protein [Oceanicola sp. 502str15]|uniref:hypothetical protein n=1 Tax=Oceanicola sp. 502str15 TaxID=2696061 RepID=UPI002095B537|nr:hypothetical protein [Oceanicola sp. 502str15]MCO6385106.1 hypothetical protein [Oceanicola sp. 502str15]